MSENIPILNLPFDLFETIAAYLSAEDLTQLCLVSRYFSATFTPLLFRSVHFLWPSKGKKHRYDGRLVTETSGFRKYMVSLELDMVARHKSYCSWPIAMTKKQRSRFIAMLRGMPDLHSFALNQLPARYKEGRPPDTLGLPWLPTLLSVFTNLGCLRLDGPSVSLYPEAVADIIISSPNMYELHIRHSGRDCPGDRRSGVIDEMVKCHLFWTKLVTLVHETSATVQGTAARRARGEPFLRLRTLGVDQFAPDCVMGLTDFSILRHLLLLGPVESMAWTGVELLGAARHIEALTVGYIGRDVASCIASVREGPSPTLNKLVIGYTTRFYQAMVPGAERDMPAGRLSALFDQRGWTHLNFPEHYFQKALGMLLGDHEYPIFTSVEHLSLRLFAEKQEDALRMVQRFEKLRTLNVKFLAPGQRIWASQQTRPMPWEGKWAAGALLGHYLRGSPLSTIVIVIGNVLGATGRMPGPRPSARAYWRVHAPCPELYGSSNLAELLPDAPAAAEQHWTLGWRNLRPDEVGDWAREVW